MSEIPVIHTLKTVFIVYSESQFIVDDDDPEFFHLCISIRNPQDSVILEPEGSLFQLAYPSETLYRLLTRFPVVDTPFIRSFSQ